MEEQQETTVVLDASQICDLTYTRRRINDFTLDENLPTPHYCHISRSPEVGLGSLDILPLELLQRILSQLDLCTLTDFRRVNQLALQSVASIPEYKAINTHANNALRGILSIKTARWITCETLYAILCTSECEQCGDFGGYLYIITCKRVCFLCFTQEQTYLPLRYSHAIQKFGLNRPILDTLPQMRTIPGTYSSNQKKCRDRFRLVDYDCARLAGIVLHESVTAMEKPVSDTADQKLLRHRKRLSQRSTGPSRSTVRRPRTGRSFDAQSGNPLRFVAIVRTPCLNRISKDVEEGFHCIGCERVYDSDRNRVMHFRRKFNVDSFNEHLRQFGRIENGKHHPD
jgi:hypothetical protein